MLKKVIIVLCFSFTFIIKPVDNFGSFDLIFDNQEEAHVFNNIAIATSNFPGINPVINDPDEYGMVSIKYDLRGCFNLAAISIAVRILSELIEVPTAVAMNQ